MGKLIVGLCAISLFFIMCKKQADQDDKARFSSLNGNKFILTIDRVSNNPNIQLPGDSLQESNYVSAIEDIQYNVAFSGNGQIVTIGSGTISGGKIKDGEESKYYNIVNGLFAGGRFLIWKNNNDFEAEYTIYGSGVPVIRSERGSLKLMTK